MHIQCLLRLGSRSSNKVVPSLISRRYLSSTANTTTSSPSENPRHTTHPQILDEHTLLSQLTPLKRIICLCPIPLGRSRIPWSGGDSNHPEDETINLNFQSQPFIQNLQQMQPLKVAKYRYGERFAIGVAVSDPYLSHAQPIHMGGGDYEDDDEVKERFVAELVPTFRCDAHNLGSSPVFHTNLPYFRHDFLQHIGHFDIGAIVLALPMQSTANPFSRTPTKVQLEQEQKLQQIRKCLLGVLQNYVSVEDDEYVDEESMIDREEDDDSDDSNSDTRRPTPLGPLNVQGCIDHRLSITEVLSKSDNDCQYGSWDNISASLRDIQNVHTMGKQLPDGSGNSGAYLSNQQYVAHNVNSSVPPEIHAAVALNAMMDKYTSGYQSGLF